LYQRNRQVEEGGRGSDCGRIAWEKNERTCEKQNHDPLRNYWSLGKKKRGLASHEGGTTCQGDYSPRKSCRQEKNTWGKESGGCRVPARRAAFGYPVCNYGRGESSTERNPENSVGSRRLSPSRSTCWGRNWGDWPGASFRCTKTSQKRDKLN